MPRFRIVLEYDGGGFSGWQRQPGQVTVQGVLEAALLRLCGHPISLVGAGRTDAGVHAAGQVAHFDTSRPRSPDVFVRALNANTPGGVTVLSAHAAPDHFHARYSATYREYAFRIFTRPQAPTLEQKRVWHHPGHLDPDAMGKATAQLLGTHDFSAFRAAACQAKNPVRTITRADVNPNGKEICIHLGANAFLQHMVRNVVGSLTLVGRGKWSPEKFQTVLFGRDRTLAGPTAPPWGLYLTRVCYPSPLPGHPQ